MKNESGQALVEAAFSLPLMLALLLGVAELGKMIYCSIEVTNAARAATQYAAMNGGAFTTSGALDATGMLNAAQGDSLNMGTHVTWATGYPPPSYSCSCSGTGTPSCNVPGSFPSGCTGSHLIITVTAYTQGTFTPDIHVIGLQTSYTLIGRSVQEVLQ